MFQFLISLFKPRPNESSVPKAVPLEKSEALTKSPTSFAEVEPSNEAPPLTAEMRPTGPETDSEKPSEGGGKASDIGSKKGYGLPRLSSLKKGPRIDRDAKLRSVKSPVLLADRL